MGMPALKKHIKFRIELQDVAVPVWREFAVPADRTMREGINNALMHFGWDLSHLWLLDIPDQAYISCGYEVDRYPWTLYAENFGMKDLLLVFACRLHYDFGDGWTMKLNNFQLVELPNTGFHTFESHGLCPAEDCGGPYMWNFIYAYHQTKNLQEALKIAEMSPRAIDLEYANDLEEYYGEYLESETEPFSGHKLVKMKTMFS